MEFKKILSKIKKYKFDLSVYIIVTFSILFWCIVLTIKYFSFGYYDRDLAFFNQAMWNLLHGRIYNSFFNVNFFGNHANFISVLFLPLYVFFPHALFLVYLKILFFGFAIIMIFLIARKNLNIKWGILFVILYFLYPPLNYSMLYEFDWEFLSTFFIFLIFYFYQQKKFKEYCFASLLLLIIKENMPFAIFMFGIHALLSDRERKWYFFSILTSILWFCLSVFLIIPYFLSSGKHGYLANYSTLSKSPGEIIKFLFSPININFLLQLFAPLMFIPFLRLDIILLGLPFFLQHLLSNQYTEHTIYRNYASSLAPFIFISTILYIKQLSNFRKNTSHLIKIIACGMMMYTLLANIYFLPELNKIFSGAKCEIVSQRRKLVKMIPKNSSVLTSFVFSAELSTRERLYAFHDVYDPVHYKDYRTIPPFDYALIDFNDIYLTGKLKNNLFRYKKISDFFMINNLGAIYAVNDNVLFKKDHVSEFKLFKEREHIDFDKVKSILINNDIRFALGELPLDVTRGQLCKIKFYWHCLKKVKEKYEIKLFLVRNDGKVCYSITHPVCYRINPTSEWKKNELIEENYNFLIPSLPKDKYLLQVLFYNYDTDIIAYLNSESDVLIRDGKIVDIGMVNIR